MPAIIPEPIRILELVVGGENELLRINDGFRTVLAPMLGEDARFADKEICIVSVAGAFRTGKSFLLNFLLRYLRSTQQNTPDWLANAGPIVEQSGGGGFPWRGGRLRDTTGVLVWPEPFVVRRADGRELVVLLLDTQGLWDNRTGARGDTHLFVFAALVASLQVFNVSAQLSMREMETLEYFARFAHARGEAVSASPVFQELLLLVRDWIDPDSFAYGAAGGDAYMRHAFFGGLEDVPDELRQRRATVRAAFARGLHCFLMPHPGDEVASHEYDGRIEDIGLEFQVSLRELVPRLLSPARLVPKTGPNGEPMTCRDWLTHFERYVSAFNGGGMPTVQTLFQAMVDAGNMSAAKDAFHHYCHRIRSFLDADNPVGDAHLSKIHETIRAEALGSFERSRKVVQRDGSATQHLDKLRAKIEVEFKRVAEQNTRARASGAKQRQSEFDRERAGFAREKDNFYRKEGNNANENLHEQQKQNSRRQETFDGLAAGINAQIDALGDQQRKIVDSIRDMNANHKSDMERIERDGEKREKKQAEMRAQQIASEKKRDEDRLKESAKRDQEHKEAMAKLVELENQNNRGSSNIVGAIVGGIVGGITGFVAGGPVGAVIGATGGAAKFSE